jgi:hypothetical protein
MLGERTINFLEAALSIAAAAYAISLARGGIPPKPARRNQALGGHSFSGTARGRKPKAMELGHERHVGFACLDRPSCNASAEAMAVRPVSA